MYSYFICYSISVFGHSPFVLCHILPGIQMILGMCEERCVWLELFRRNNSRHVQLFITKTDFYYVSFGHPRCFGFYSFYDFVKAWHIIDDCKFDTVLWSVATSFINCIKGVLHYFLHTSDKWIYVLYLRKNFNSIISIILHRVSLVGVRSRKGKMWVGRAYALVSLQKPYLVTMEQYSPALL